MVKVKICGITTIVDAVTTVRYGAGALGLILYPESLLVD
jgi:phosphoribosylanthranilate isomerase